MRGIKERCSGSGRSVWRRTTGGLFGKKAAAMAAAMAVMIAMPAYPADIGDFLTGGALTQTQGTGGTGTPDAAPGGGTTDTAQTAAQSTQALNMVTCTDSQTGINVARAVVPEGYSVNSETTWCGVVQSPDYPASVFVDAKSPDGSIELTYESPIEFCQLLNASVGGMQFRIHQDWTFNTDSMMMMLTYMNAQQYCDYVSQNCMPQVSGMTYVSEKTVTDQAHQLLQQTSQQTLDEINQFLAGFDGVYVDYVETSAAERTYRYTDASGKAKMLVISCVVQGLRMVEDFPATATNITNIIWSVPGRYCLMVDEDKFDEGMAVFESFCNNTTISDQFKQAMRDLSDKIMQAVLNAQATTISSQESFVQDTFSEELSGQEDTYSSIEAWDDVIMDRNDYTLSNGDSVKVDTSYDYVYELSDGGVYATNSALDEPAGGTLLYAN